MVLRGLALNLAKDKAGKTNWDDLIAGTPEKDESSGAQSAPDLALNVQGVDISDAQFVWDDQQSGKRYELGNIRLETGTIASGKTVPIDLEFNLNSTAPKQTHAIDLSAQLTANDDFTRIQIADLVAQLAAAGEGLPQSGLDLTVNADIDYDQAAGTMVIEALKLDGPNVALTGALSATELAQEPKLSGNFQLAESNLKQLLALGGTPPVTADPNALSSVSAEFGIEGSASRAALKPFTVTLDDSTFTGDFAIESFTGPALRFSLQLDEIDLGPLFAAEI